MCVLCVCVVCVCCVCVLCVCVVCVCVWGGGERERERRRYDINSYSGPYDYYNSTCTVVSCLEGGIMPRGWYHAYTYRA